MTRIWMESCLIGTRTISFYIYKAIQFQNQTREQHFSKFYIHLDKKWNLNNNLQVEGYVIRTNNEIIQEILYPRKNK